MTILFIGVLSYAGRSQQTDPSVQLSYFTNIPKVIDGCMEAYTHDTTSLKKKKYILLTNMQELAMIHVNGKTISLQKVSSTPPANHVYKDVYKGEGYTVIVIVKEIKEVGDEGSYMKGTVEIKFGSFDFTLKIHGTAGC